MPSIRIIVSGRVQGVAFRHYTQREAERLGLDGWVKNLPNGDVEIVASGDQLRLDEMAAWARRGAPFGKVTGVAVTPVEGWVESRGFTVQR